MFNKKKGTINVLGRKIPIPKKETMVKIRNGLSYLAVLQIGRLIPSDSTSGKRLNKKSQKAKKAKKNIK